MWIVRLALRRPYTFIVLAVLIVILGLFAIVRAPIDIFPNINIPIVATIWRYSGLSPTDLANQITSNIERTAQVSTNDVEHTESQSLPGMSVIKYFFQPNVQEQMAFAQITAISQTQIKQAPLGTGPPFVLAYSAASVPIVQLTLDSPSASEAQLFDYSNSVVRTALASVSGAQMPFPYGGKQRQVQVDLDPEALRAKGLSAVDVSNAIGAQNLILPAGTEKISDIEYNVELNASPADPRELNDVPVRTVNGTVVFVRDVAHVRDGSAPQTNLVRVDGRHSVMMSVIKTGGTSTLQIIQQIKDLLPSIKAQLPPDININATADQSLFVRAAVNGVIREGAIAAALTALMVLLFLGTWRSTLIITISIPLSVLASIICLSAIGETINIMTLGGLALAVGILVDNATVTIENINWNLEQGKDVESAILDGAQQIALPTLVSTLCICIVFVPMFFLTGISKFLFVPLAEAAVFATLASYVLSRTLVPTLAMYWLHKHQPGGSNEFGGGPIGRLLHGFERGFARVRQRYHELLAAAVHHGPAFILAFMAIGATAFLLLPWLGRDFFPTVDAGQVRLHLRARSGMRLEQTAELCDAVEAEIRRVIPANQLDHLIDNIGLPNSGINLSYSTSAPIGPGDADIMLSLRPGHPPTAQYVRLLRARLRQEFPAVTFSFLPADIVNQILNFGLPAPLDVQVVGESPDNRAFANALLAKLRAVPGTADMRIQQVFDYPQLNVNVDRTNAALVGLTQQDVANNLLISLSGSFQTAPTFWVDPKNGLQYSITTQAPQYRLTSLQDLAATPLRPSNAATAVGGGSVQLLANVASIQRGVGQGVVSHFNARPVIDIYGSVDGTDLGSVASAVRKILDEVRPSLPRGSQLMVRGQIETMQSSFTGLALGVIGAIVLMYLLIVVNFQSWIDPLIIITALPAAFAGMVWMLFSTYTTISVPALIGAIMGVGVATANSILVVSFARERMDAGLSATAAAVEAGFVRFRPVVMTALAMVVGMLPMSLGMGEGGEQNAPLGRAVIGGLIFATFATLLFVPVVFAVVHGKLRGTLGSAHAGGG